MGEQLIELRRVLQKKSLPDSTVLSEHIGVFPDPALHCFFVTLLVLFYLMLFQLPLLLLRIMRLLLETGQETCFLRLLPMPFLSPIGLCFSKLTRVLLSSVLTPLKVFPKVSVFDSKSHNVHLYQYLLLPTFVPFP